MHVERQRRGWAALAQGFIGECMTKEIEACPAERLADRQRQKALRSQAIVILDRMGGVAVMVGRSGGEICGQIQAFLPQPFLLFADPEVHLPALLGGASLPRIDAPYRDVRHDRPITRASASSCSPWREIGFSSK